MCVYKFIARNTNNESEIIFVEAECDVEAWKEAMSRALGRYGAFLNGVELLYKRNIG